MILTHINNRPNVIGTIAQKMVCLGYSLFQNILFWLLLVICLTHIITDRTGTELYRFFLNVTGTIVQKIICLAYNHFCKFLYEINLYGNVNKAKEAQRRYYFKTALYV